MSLKDKYAIAGVGLTKIGEISLPKFRPRPR